MKKELKDYLHLYLGCECKVNGVDEKLILTGVSYDDTQRVHWGYFENTELGYAPVTELKPILRPLSDMTEEEKLDIAKMHNDKVDWKIVDNKPIARINIGIQEWLDIDSDMVLVHEIKNNIFNQESDGGIYRASMNGHEYTRYLLSKHFDLFGLCDAGLAIDATTLKH